MSLISFRWVFFVYSCEILPCLPFCSVIDNMRDSQIVIGTFILFCEIPLAMVELHFAFYFLHYQAHGISHEASTGFAFFGMLQIYLNQDYAGGRYWADVTRALIKKLEPVNKKARLSLVRK